MVETRSTKPVPGTMYEYDNSLDSDLASFRQKVDQLRSVGKLSPETLRRLRGFFRIRNIYHSNAIEGNLLDLGETRLVVEEGLTITGKPLSDSLEAKNLSHALDLFETLADRTRPIIAVNVRSIHAAVLKGIDDNNAGKYRTVPVEITGSAYRPPSPEKVPPMMDEFFEWLKTVTDPSRAPLGIDPIVLACAAHAWFVYIHPFIDGNGRVARLLMNLVLMRYGYPIAIITREDRQRYYDALEQSQVSDLTPFIALVLESSEESLEEYERAVAEQRQFKEWARSIVAALDEKELLKIRNEYEVWRSAMDLFKGYFRQTIDALREEAAERGFVRAFFKDFGFLEFEKYVALKQGESVKKTWFFRVDFRLGDLAARYLFFFGHTSYKLRQQMGRGVTLHVACETRPFHYEKLNQMDGSEAPDLVEVGYLLDEEHFLGLLRDGRFVRGRVEQFGRDFIHQVTERAFSGRATRQ